MTTAGGSSWTQVQGLTYSALLGYGQSAINEFQSSSTFTSTTYGNNWANNPDWHQYGFSLQGGINGIFTPSRSPRAFTISVGNGLYADLTQGTNNTVLQSPPYQMPKGQSFWSGLVVPLLPIIAAPFAFAYFAPAAAASSETVTSGAITATDTGAALTATQADLAAGTYSDIQAGASTLSTDTGVIATADGSIVPAADNGAALTSTQADLQAGTYGDAATTGGGSGTETGGGSGGTTAATAGAGGALPSLSTVSQGAGLLSTIGKLLTGGAAGATGAGSSDASLLAGIPGLTLIGIAAYALFSR